MTTAYRSIFDSADWIEALDRQLAEPPTPPPAKDEPEIAGDFEPEIITHNDTLPYRVGDAPRHRRRLRNLPWAIVATSAAMIYMLLVIVAFDAPLWLRWAALVVCVLEFLIWLLAAWRFNRL